MTNLICAMFFSACVLAVLVNMAARIRIPVKRRKQKHKPTIRYKAKDHTGKVKGWAIVRRVRVGRKATRLSNGRE